MQSMLLRGISEHKSLKGFLFVYMPSPNLSFSSSSCNDRRGQSSAICCYTPKNLGSLLAYSFMKNL